MYPASAGVLKVKSAGLMQDGNIWTGRQSQAGFTHEQHPYDGILIGCLLEHPGWVPEGL